MSERGTRFNRVEIVTNPEADQRLRRLYIDALAQL